MLSKNEKKNYLVREEIYVPTEEQSLILGLMGYAAYKLWNVANYERRNWKELGLEEYPDWYDQKRGSRRTFSTRTFPLNQRRERSRSSTNHGGVIMRSRSQAASRTLSLLVSSRTKCTSYLFRNRSKSTETGRFVSRFRNS